MRCVLAPACTLLRTSETGGEAAPGELAALRASAAAAEAHAARAEAAVAAAEAAVQAARREAEEARAVAEAELRTGLARQQEELVRRGA